MTPRALVWRSGQVVLTSLGWEIRGHTGLGAGSSSQSRVWLGPSEVQDIPMEMSSV